jgi:membrane dipeptidase
MESGAVAKSGDYAFGLSDAEEQRAAKLHAGSIIFDWVNQHIGGSNIFDAYPPALKAELQSAMTGLGVGWAACRAAFWWPYEMSLQGRSDIIKDWYLASGLTCGTYGMPVHDGAPRMLEAEAAMMRYAELPWARCVTTAQEIRQCKRDGLIALYAHWQPTVPLPRDLAAIDRAYGKGLRALCLTYNRMDSVGVGCTERVDAGLSMFGIDVVRRCESLGVIVDTSHCGHMTTLDACRHATRPVTASHTCARAVFDTARAKSDDALKAVAGTGGVIGVMAAPFLLSKSPNPTIDAYLDHICYIADLVGWRHVSLGTDWPFQAPDDVQRAVLGPETWIELGFRPEDRLDVSDRAIGFDDYRDLLNITRGLVKRGFSDEQVRGILGENALRVFEAVCG